MKKQGFTWLELLIIIVLIVLISGIVIPALFSVRRGANETFAVATLRSIKAAQDQFKASGSADADKDGVYEYGSLSEVATYMVPSHDITEGNSLYGYRFAIFVPFKIFSAVERADHTLVPLVTAVSTDDAETSWCAYAWPAMYGETGNRTFFINEAGVVTATECSSYSGPGAFGLGESGRAFLAGQNPAISTGVPAVGTIGRDGQLWKRVE